jgi:glycosyltransferase involved in cell wall biosynthesis
MKVIHLNHFDIYGGAARAAYRIHGAVRQAGVDSWMGVDHKASDDLQVFGPGNKLEKALIRLRLASGRCVTSLLQSNNTILHSPSIFDTAWPNRLKALNADIIHMHWICHEMLSIRDIGSLSLPIVWTFHDMWPFCGAEHYTDDCRWQDGYMRTNRPHHESGFDLNRWVWERKRKHWKHSFQIVTPSHWLANCVRESKLMRDWPVSVIPNPIDTDVWAPVDQRIARSLLGLPQDEPLVLFGAIGGRMQHVKGFDLLLKALEHVADVRKDIHLAIFGESAPRDPLSLPFPVHYIGHLQDNVSLRLLYSAADVMIIPSRQDNLPNTGVESLACGTPVAAFDTCGLPDIVEHKLTGYLAKAFDPEDLAKGICWIVDNGRANNISRNARNKALQIFSAPLVAKQYFMLYKQI